MEKDSLRRILLQHAERELNVLVDGISQRCVDFLESGNPKEFESNLGRVFKKFSGTMTPRALESLDGEATEKVKERGHNLIDDGSRESPFKCCGRVDKKGKKQVSWDSTLGDLRVNRQTGRCKTCGRWMGFLDELLEITP